jgi:hypothetical protein
VCVRVCVHRGGENWFNTFTTKFRTEGITLCQNNTTQRITAFMQWKLRCYFPQLDPVLTLSHPYVISFPKVYLTMSFHPLLGLLIECFTCENCSYISKFIFICCAVYHRIIFKTIQLNCIHILLFYYYFTCMLHSFIHYVTQSVK